MSTEYQADTSVSFQESIVEAEEYESRNWRERISTGAAAAAFAFQQSPGNEALRAYAAVNVLQATQNPLIVGAVVGAVTLGIETTSSLAIANELNNNNSSIQRIVDRFKKTTETDIESSVSKATDAGLALAVGAGAIIVKRHTEQSRSFKEDVATSVKTSSFIAGVSAGIAGLAGGGIEYADRIGLGSAAEVSVNILSDWRTYVGALALGQTISYGKKRFIKNRLEVLNNKILDADITLSEIHPDDDVAIKSAEDLEQRIWDINDFGSLDEYEIYKPQSKIFSAFRDGEAVGMTRMFEGGPELPPFMSMDFFDESEKLEVQSLCMHKEIEELGTTAVDHERSGVSRGVLSLHMWRLAYRDARARGVKSWGIIMEPERVEKMNKRFNFTFKQLGPAIDYQGGDCAPFIMDLEEVDSKMQSGSRQLYDWFVNEPIE